MRRILFLFGKRTNIHQHNFWFVYLFLCYYLYLRPTESSPSIDIRYFKVYYDSK
jgi:hypothetical protein